MAWRPSVNAFELFDVGLYLDPEATGVAPKWEMPDEAEELRRVPSVLSKLTLLTWPWVFPLPVPVMACMVRGRCR